MNIQKLKEQTRLWPGRRIIVDADYWQPWAVARMGDKILVRWTAKKRGGIVRAIGTIRLVDVMNGDSLASLPEIETTPAVALPPTS